MTTTAMALLALFLAAQASCGQNDQGTSGLGERKPAGEESNLAQLKRSLKTWNGLKAKCQGNYSYKIRWSSWVGFGHETEIVVGNNKVTERRYREWSDESIAEGSDESPVTEGRSWTEQGRQLGSHDEGAPAKTLDQLYQEAETVLDHKLQPNERLFVEFDDRGLLKSCFYVDTGIADDSPQTGVEISGIKLEISEK